MKNYLKRILILLVFLASSSFTIQCWFSSLQDDLKIGSTEFKSFVKNDDEAFASYEILYNQAPALKTNVEELKLVSKNLDKINNAGGYLKWRAASGLASPASLGKLIKKVGDYEVYEGGEIFYRAMEEKHYERLLKGEGIIGSGETFTSPTLNYILYGTKSGNGYDGIIVKFQMKPGTFDLLKRKALINDKTDYMREIFVDEFPRGVNDVNKWGTRDYALFKTESYHMNSSKEISQVNIALGKADALAEFNKNILFFEVIPRVKK